MNVQPELCNIQAWTGPKEKIVFKHIVMWRLKENDQGDPKEVIAARMKSILEGLQDKIAQIKTIEVGIDIGKTPSSFDVVLYSEFNSQEDCAIYMQHPDHKKAGEYIGQVTAERVVVDYKV